MQPTKFKIKKLKLKKWSQPVWWAWAQGGLWISSKDFVLRSKHVYNHYLYFELWPLEISNKPLTSCFFCVAQYFKSEHRHHLKDKMFILQHLDWIMVWTLTITNNNLFFKPFCLIFTHRSWFAVLLDHPKLVELQVTDPSSIRSSIHKSIIYTAYLSGSRRKWNQWQLIWMRGGVHPGQGTTLQRG